MTSNLSLKSYNSTRLPKLYIKKKKPTETHKCPPGDYHSKTYIQIL